MSSEEKVVGERIRWVPLVALTALLSFIGTVAVALNGTVGQVFMCRYAWGTFSKTMAIPIMGVILILLTYPLKRLGLRASQSTLVTLFIVGMAVSYYGIGHYETFACWPVGFARTVLQSTDELKQLMGTWWWQPRYEVVELITAGGAATDWGSWGGSIAFWSLYLLVLFALGSSMMLLFRRRWLDVEKVPFPHIMAIGEIMRRVGPGGGERKAWPFIAGLVIGFAFEAIILLTNLFPWFPDPLAWRTGLTGETTSAQGCVCIHPGDPLGSILVHWGGYTKNLLPFAIYYLAPLAVSFTVTIVTLFMFIADQIAFAMGYYTGIFGMGGSCRVQGWGGMEASYGYGPPFYWVFTTSIGGTLAMAVMLIFHSRSYLAETIRAARRGSAPEMEGKEPFGYRTIYMMLGASAVLVLAFFMMAGLGAGTAFSVLIVSGIVNTLSAVYVLGLSGSAYIHNSYMWADWPLRFTWPQAPDTYTTGWIMSHVFASNGINHVTMGFQTGAYLTMQGLSLSGMSTARARDLFLLMALCAIVAIPIANITRVWITNLLGTGRVPIWGSCAVTNWCNDGFERYNAVSTIIQLEAGTVGFIIVTALSLLHARFVWWPIHPVGFLLATSTTAMYMFEWNAFVGAWVAKALTLRIGGSKAYGDYGVPVAAGIIGGIVFASFVAYILGIIRFFVPF